MTVESLISSRMRNLSKKEYFTERSRIYNIKHSLLMEEYITVNGIIYLRMNISLHET